MQPNSGHFKGKTAVDHVVEAQAKGIIAAAEIHGTEIPGSIAAGTDAIRETVVILLILHIFSVKFHWDPYQSLAIFLVFIFGWLFWKTGRSAWLGWSRLERLHRILEEERWEIEHNRSQEREELKALYAAKGFQGQLLEDVLDVLMADGDRLLKVMVEEELGLTLEVHEHPLRQGLGAAFGVIIASLIVFLGYILGGSIGLYLGSILLIGTAAYIAARTEGNEIIPAIIWNVALAGLALGTSYFLFDFLKNLGWLI